MRRLLLAGVLLALALALPQAASAATPCPAGAVPRSTYTFPTTQTVWGAAATIALTFNNTSPYDSQMTDVQVSAGGVVSTSSWGSDISITVPEGAGDIPVTLSWDEYPLRYPSQVCTFTISGVIPVKDPRLPCPAGTPQALTVISWPDFIAWGRRGMIRTVDASDETVTGPRWSVNDAGVQLSAEGRTLTDAGPAVSFDFSLLADRGQPAISVSLTYRQDHSPQVGAIDDACTQTITHSIPSGRGAVPPVRVTSTGGASVSFTLGLNPSSCSAVALVSAELRVGERSLRTRDVCSAPTSTTTATWRASGRPGSFALTAYGNRPARQDLPFTLSVAGRPLRVGMIHIRREYIPPRRIWDYQRDAFNNVCIKQARETRSQGGHLYCSTQSSLTIAVTVSAHAPRGPHLQTG
jgi:hypothetical protein